VQSSVQTKDQRHLALGAFRHAQLLDFSGIPAEDANGSASLDAMNLPKSHPESESVGPKPLPIADGENSYNRQPQPRQHGYP